MCKIEKENNNDKNSEYIPSMYLYYNTMYTCIEFSLSMDVGMDICLVDFVNMMIICGESS